MPTVWRSAPMLFELPEDLDFSPFLLTELLVPTLAVRCIVQSLNDCSFASLISASDPALQPQTPGLSPVCPAWRVTPRFQMPCCHHLEHCGETLAYDMLSTKGNILQEKEHGFK